MGLMDRDYFVEESLKRIGIIDRKASLDPRRPAAASATRVPSPSTWRPVLVVAGLAVVLAVAVRGSRAGWW